MKNYSGVKSLRVYKESYEFAMEIFNLTKKFPKEDVYSLTDQIRRSSRSVCANLSEAYRRRSYPKHFKSKLHDCDAELAETLTWIDFSLDCGYIDQAQHASLYEKGEKIGGMLGTMIADPQKFLPFKTNAGKN